MAKSRYAVLAADGAMFLSVASLPLLTHDAERIHVARGPHLARQQQRGAHVRHLRVRKGGQRRRKCGAQTAGRATEERVQQGTLQPRPYHNNDLSKPCTTSLPDTHRAHGRCGHVCGRLRKRLAEPEVRHLGHKRHPPARQLGAAQPAACAAAARAAGPARAGASTGGAAGAGAEGVLRAQAGALRSSLTQQHVLALEVTAGGTRGVVCKR